MKKSLLKKQDFMNATEVKWCPGCGDYAILAALQRILPELNHEPERHVFVSGIGCAGRLPYYMNTYGFHTIHGRATAIATGLKSMRDDLCVWVITGDGDALSIGGNHLIHCLRRNVNLKILLINNQVYGLTKGQFSPTSKQGLITKTSPEGVSHQPINPLSLALAAGASFVARGVDKDPNYLGEILKLAYAHQGCALVEIYQDCNIFNHGAFDQFSLKENRAGNTLTLKQGEPLLFGEQSEWGLILDNDQLVKVPSSEATHFRHDHSNYLSAMRLASLTYPEHPVPLGVYYGKEREIYQFNTQAKHENADLSALYRSRASWKQG